MGSDAKTVATTSEKEISGSKRKTPDTNTASPVKSGDEKEKHVKSDVNADDEESSEDKNDDEEEDAEEAGDDDEEDESAEEDLAPQTKKRRTGDSGSENSANESEPELNMTEDDLVGVDTSNIIPRSRRRAAVAADALASEEIAASEGVGPASAAPNDDEEEEGESSDEAEF
ncbi:uncharacterized protein CCR75_002745 [Bremia lactucae]|uniref:Histone chaperone domain-containing protein n=1 Tax=Bremia lactucae TaxID=4779 RepID=A0A976FGH8_BRELC|nr:hypothetical protein CCR75_002745 [Bremia lactucae]